MSRIEEALKKAASRRHSSRDAEGDTPEALTPAASAQAQPATAGRAASRTLAEQVRPLLEVPPLQADHLLLVTARDEKNAVVEEYNKLRSSLIALTKGERFLNTVMITSTVSEEGKSMTALNLAISLAKEQDHTVLLVDTDLRRPALHKYLNISPEVGLIQCLRDNLPLEKALIKTGLGKLVFLPAGGLVKDPIDLLSSNRMAALVRELRQRYPERYVIFDTPPALPFADAGVLAGIVDATLFVVREGKSKLEDVVKTLEDLKEHHLLGVVYNDAHHYIGKHDYYYDY